MSESKAPEKVEYNGWKLFEKVIICAKPWTGRSYINDKALQGYVVEPGNKKQLESAKSWGDYTEYGPYDYEKHEYKWTKNHPAQIYEFENSGFTLELLESANGSNQGGKLSFWNCKITKDDKIFIIGIAADLLLDVLKTHTVVDGVVQGSLMFARYKGSVGMLSADMDAYKEAVADMQAKAVMSKGKTSKHKVGKVYGTITLANVYAGDFYIWYEPIYEEDKGRYSWSYTTQTLVGFKKLAQPKVVKYFPRYYDGQNKLSDYGKTFNYFWDFAEKLPKRVELATEIELDISKEDLVNNWLQKAFFDEYDKWLTATEKHEKYEHRFFISHIAEYLGISSNNQQYEFSDKIKEILKTSGYYICDEKGNFIN